MVCQEVPWRRALRGMRGPKPRLFRLVGVRCVERELDNGLEAWIRLSGRRLAWFRGRRRGSREFLANLGGSFKDGLQPEHSGR